MKKVLLLICCLVATLSIVSAFSSSANSASYADKDVMTVIAKKDYCTIVAFCPNGKSIQCSENNSNCNYCSGYVAGWLAGGGCSDDGNQQ